MATNDNSVQHHLGHSLTTTSFFLKLLFSQRLVFKIIIYDHINNNNVEHQDPNMIHSNKQYNEKPNLQ